MKIVRESLNEETNPNKDSYYQLVGDMVINYAGGIPDNEEDLIGLISSMLKEVTVDPKLRSYLMNDSDFISDTLSYISDNIGGHSDDEQERDMTIGHMIPKDSDQAFKRKWGGDGNTMPF